MTNPLMPRLTLSDAWGVLRGHIISTLGRVLLFAVLWLIFWAVNSSLKDSSLSLGLSEVNGLLKAIPWWIYTSIACSFFFWWFGRGGRVTLPFPLIDFKLWLFLTLVTFASLAAGALLPLWIGFPLFYFLNPLFYMEKLIEASQNKNLQENE